MECCFCKKILKNGGILKTHQKTAKYCLKIQGVDASKGGFECLCGMSFTTKLRLTSHAGVCSINNECVRNLLERKNSKILALEDETRELKTVIRELKSENKILMRSQNCMEEVARQPKIMSNKTVNNKVSFLTPLDLSCERLKELVETNFNNSYLLEGQKGVARFTFEHVIKDEDGKLQYICTDPARHTFRFRNGGDEN